MERQQEEAPRRKKDKKKERQNQYRWAIKVFLISFVITAVLSLISGESMNSLPVIIAFILLFIFIFIGILFDIIGLAVATAAESPFHSMASRKSKIGKTAVMLLKNADKVASVCNDVIGDIAGVVSGATGAAIAAKIFINEDYGFWITLLLTSCIAALTVGGKALGKRIAMTKSVEIVMGFAKVICLFTGRDSKKKQNRK
ncbi:MAG: hypothetical protein A2Y17_12000 [Clostridiales bacterium GWF2_38_85]|nr:MAG: hypothetical protein A2Y17_12000 [Clostridiales bacterium GWF2_38_85]